MPQSRSSCAHLLPISKTPFSWRLGTLSNGNLCGQGGFEVRPPGPPRVSRPTCQLRPALLPSPFHCKPAPTKRQATGSTAAELTNSRLRARHPESLTSPAPRLANTLRILGATHRASPGPPLFLRVQAQVCLILFRTNGIGGCAILSWRPSHRVFSAGWRKTTRWRARGECVGGHSVSAPEVPDAARSVLYVSLIVHKAGLLVSSQNAGAPCQNPRPDLSRPGLCAITSQSQTSSLSLVSSDSRPGAC